MGFVKDNFLGKAEKDGAKAQKRAGREAIEIQEAAREQARQDLSPFRELGTGVSGSLLDFVLQGPETELERSRGFQDIQRSAAAGGKLQSGGTLEELTSFNNMLNARNRSQRFGELFNLASLGSNAAAGQATASLQTGNAISDLRTGIGNAHAAGQIGAANRVGGTISDLAGFAGLV